MLHGRVVHCYGGPFYAGWGLTVDHLPLPARQRKVSLDTVVHVVMFDYPRYVLPGIPGFTSAEQVMRRLGEQSASSGTAPGTGWLSRKLRKGRALADMMRSEWLARS